MFPAGLFITAKNWKRLKCLSTDKWISKLEYIQLMEFYLAVERNEPLIQQYLNKSQTLSYTKEAKSIYHMIHFHEILQ